MAQTPEKSHIKTQSHEGIEVLPGRESDDHDDKNASLDAGIKATGKDQDKATHGENVSTVAKETEPGQGHGEIVSQQAKTNGEAKKIRERTSAGNHFAKGQMKARVSAINRNNTRIRNSHVPVRK